MTGRKIAKSGGDVEFGEAAARVFAANERMNRMVIEGLDARAWTAKAAGDVRTIAAIFTHVHNVRVKWVRLTAPKIRVPAQLKKAGCTPRMALAGLAKSAEACEEMLQEVLSDEAGSRKFLRDGWARPWTAGVEMLSYMVMHEGHHRGQVLLLAHQLGFPVAKEVNYGIWNWEKIWRESGWKL
jgi:uncharacterized damage-inducible protein DinB